MTFTGSIEIGQTISGRYRIITLLGRGGMGEVYRADDLELGSSIALKFLPLEMSAEPSRLEMLRAEVRSARQVSHPNVCRVFDIGQAETEMGPRPYLAMEFIDGENLSSLLTRIGRFPKEKAVETARQICLGLAAIHEQQLVHRDLKPANIMLDGRGRARLTDFGVAIGAGDQRAGLAGTPAYMAPEQALGERASKATDIYALGLVLYELFTGRPGVTARSLAEARTFHQSATPTKPSEHVDDLDPAVERIILRCLENDPAERPGTALGVASALPGGDMLAAVLAAGETPSPELVARSGRTGALSPAAAGGLLAVCAALVIAIVLLGSYLSVLRLTPMPLPPDALAARAREITEALGVKGEPVSEAWGFQYDSEYLATFTGLGRAGQIEALGRVSPTSVHFWYRRSAEGLVPQQWWRRAATLNDPPWRRPGEVLVITDSRGRLLQFERVPSEVGLSRSDVDPLARQAHESNTLGTLASAPLSQGASAVPSPGSQHPPPRASSGARAARAVDSPSEPVPDSVIHPWLGAVLRATGFDAATLQECTPRRAPAVGADSRMAWKVPLAGPTIPPGSTATIEAAALDDELVSMRVLMPWNALADPDRPPERDTVGQVGRAISIVLIAAAIICGAWLARRNTLTRRSDTRGAFNVALFMVTAELVAMIVARHSLGDTLSVDIIGRVLARAVWAGVLSGVLYLALEPYIRKFWPELIVSWTRLVGGAWRNPRVGRDVLIGMAVGLMLVLIMLVVTTFGAVLGHGERTLTAPDLTSLAGAPFVLSILASAASGAATSSLMLGLLLVGVRVLVRSNLAAYGMATAIMSLMLFTDSVVTASGVIVGIVAAGLFTLVMVRVGILAATSAMFVIAVLTNAPLIASLSSWTATPSLIIGASLVALAAFAARLTSKGHLDRIAATPVPAGS